MGRSKLALLTLGTMLFYGWTLAPVEHQAQVWNASGAIARIALLWSLVWPARSSLMLWVAVWWTAEDLMVAGCSVLYVFQTWPIAPGDAQCSALLQFDIGKVGAAVVILLLLALRRRDGNL